jgi:mono/diheme cytochrome c family protein
MQWYMNAYEAPHPFSGYRYAISGKPFWSLPANIPVTFELVILFSAFSAFFAMIAFNGLPKFANPLFLSPRFRRVTDDKFFLFLDARDPLYAEVSVDDAFRSIGSTATETIWEQPETPMPTIFKSAVPIITLIALMPLGYIALSRGMTSEIPRVSIWWDMDYQPRFGPQTLVKQAERDGYDEEEAEVEEPQYNTFAFPDGRGSRLPVEGTIARGQLVLDQRLLTGIEPGGETTPVAMLLQDDDEPAGDQPADDQPADETTEPDTATDNQAGEAAANGATADGAAPADGATPPAPVDNTPWVTEFPEGIKVDMATMERGRERFNIYCAACHGRAGAGDGLASQRAMQLRKGTWTQAADLHSDIIRDQPVGKIYNTITNGSNKGQGKMPGYAEQIPLEDRWAITLYVKALQRSRNAPAEELSSAP